jgi:hypothetical protein
LLRLNEAQEDIKPSPDPEQSFATVDDDRELLVDLVHREYLNRGDLDYLLALQEQPEEEEPARGKKKPKEVKDEKEEIKKLLDLNQSFVDGDILKIL